MSDYVGVEHPGHPSYPYSPDPAQKVITPLETILDQEGIAQWDLWRVFLQACHMTLDRLPSVFHQTVEVASGGREPVQAFSETQEETAQWHQEVTRHFRYYPEESTHLLAQAFGALLDNTTTPEGELTYADTIGNAYMAFFRYKGNGRAQYFTPWNVAYCMAQMGLCGIDWEEEMRRRFVDHVKGREDREILETMLFAISLCGEVPEWREAAENIFWRNAFPLWRRLIEPFTICDPACGSGIMLLAAARSIPRGLIDLGMIQFYGIDIDPICVEMARLNMRLYGLIPLGIQPATLELLSRVDLGSPYQELYTGRLCAETEEEAACWQEGIDLARQGQLALWEVSTGSTYQGLDDLAISPETRRSISRSQGHPISVKMSHPEAMQLSFPVLSEEQGTGEMAPGDVDAEHE